MSDTIYCYHCRTYHPKDQMRQLETKTGKRWRCIKSIEATKRSQAMRDAYGQEVTAMNKAESQAKLRRAKEATGQTQPG